MEYCQTLLLQSSSEAQFSICLFSPAASEPAARDTTRPGIHTDLNTHTHTHTITHNNRLPIKILSSHSLHNSTLVGPPASSPVSSVSFRPKRARSQPASIDPTRSTPPGPAPQRLLSLAEREQWSELSDCGEPGHLGTCPRVRGTSVLCPSALLQTSSVWGATKCRICGTASTTSNTTAAMVICNNSSRKLIP